MELFCSTCGSKTLELIECEGCGNVGCPKCLLKIKGKWLCEKCRKGEESLFSMFS